MNSEELELSLRNEFESYLKNVLADMKQEVSELQTKVHTELERQKTQLDEVFKDFSARIEKDRELDAPFKDSVVEHLRLSRDEGARITAAAIAEAEKLEAEQQPTAAAPQNFAEIRDAISDISSQDSQSAILKSLVNHAAQFTARGAFFIIKNEHFVGWRVFGKEAETDEQDIREIFFPMANETLLSESVRSLSAIESSYGTYSDDSLYLNKLEFGQPENMYAIPLVARGRGVAVLYADYGTKGESVNVEALETLVRVAGLTVELIAAGGQAPKQAPAESYAAYSGTENSEPASSYQTAASNYDFSPPSPQSSTEASDGYAVQNEYESASFANYGESTETPKNEYSSEEFQYQPIDAPASEFGAEEKTAENNYSSAGSDYEFTSNETSSSYDYAAPETSSAYEIEETGKSDETQTTSGYSWNRPVESFDAADESFAVQNEKEETSFNITSDATEQTDAYSNAASDYAFESTQSYNEEVSSSEEPAADTSQYKQWEPESYQETSYDSSRFETTETNTDSNANNFEQYNGNAENFAAPETNEPAASSAAANASSVANSAPPVQSRFSERSVDLPIEVSEDERRSHNDARRFARLLVSEIKLYNEQKVKEGRESSDLYERLREAIDRSREMYDKRVQPPVASKFDYFHYELVSNLAEGDASRLGASYPGASV